MNGLNHNGFIGNPLNNSSQFLKFFLRSVFVSFQNGWTGLHVAARQGSVHTLKELIQAGGDVNLIDNVSKP